MTKRLFVLFPKVSVQVNILFRSLRANLRWLALWLAVAVAWFALLVWAVPHIEPWLADLVGGQIIGSGPK